MVSDERIRDEVEKTLLSWDGDALSGPDPLLLSRIEDAIASQGGHHFRAAFRQVLLPVAGIIVLCLLNFVTLYFIERRSNSDLQSKVVSQLQVEFQTDEGQSNF